MAFCSFSRYIVFSLLLLYTLKAESSIKNQSFSFLFEKFEKNRHFDTEFALYGNAEVENSRIRIFSKGTVVCKKPIRFYGTNPGFSTNFSFSAPKGVGNSLDFILVPKNSKAIIFPKFVVVKFGSNVNGSYAAVDIASEVFAANLSFESGEMLHACIIYDGFLKVIEVRVGKVEDLKRSNSVISFPIDLSNALWNEAMYVGIRCLSESYTSVYSWSFEATHGTPYVMHSEPLNPDTLWERSHGDIPTNERRTFHWKIFMALLVGAICGAFVASLVFILRSNVIKRHPIAPVDWETKNEKIVMNKSKVMGSATAS